MNVLVTGGAGYIGSFILKKIKYENNVIVFDNFSTGGKEVIDLYPQVKFIEGDLRNKEDIKKLFSENKIDQIIHLAAIPSVKACNEDPEGTYENNVISTKNLLDIAKDYDVKRIIFASSSGVYGEPEEYPITENTPLDPLNYYTKQKVECENLIIASKIPYLILRKANLWGVSVHTKLIAVIPTFIRKIIKNEPIEIYGTGEQKRDFMHVSDGAQAYFLALNSDLENKIINICGNLLDSIKNLADRISKIGKELGYSPVIVFKPNPREEAVDPNFEYRTLYPDVIGYKPKKDFNEGIKELFEYIKIN